MSRTLLRGRPLIMASNRGPLDHQIVGGELRATRGTGGVVTTLSSLSHYVPLTWVAAAMSEGDRRVARRAGVSQLVTEDQELYVRYVVTPRSVYHRYYNVFSNPFLWFHQHSMWDLSYAPNIESELYDAWERGYVPVNRAFATAIAEEAGAGDGSPVVILHDYHLYLTAGMLREAMPHALIQHFIHIPWPPAGAWTLIPTHMRSAILDSLCQCDILGFQTSWDVRNFLLSCETLVSGVEVDFATQAVRRAGHTLHVRPYPVSVDVDELRATAESPAVEDYVRRLRHVTAETTIVRVDRLEPSKNILRGFRAYEMLLGRHPELLERVTFLAFLVPSRTDIREYRRYTDEVMDIIQRINSTFGQPGWQPIHLFYQENYTHALAGMRLSDVLLVNPVVDGMNLVAKEGPVLSSKDGVVVLSERAGAYEQLQPGVISVSPIDIEGTVSALYQAVTMERKERIRRSRLLRLIIEGSDLTDWLLRQLEDLAALHR